MKQLYLIGGTRGVGKTAVCQRLKGFCQTVYFLMGTGAGIRSVLCYRGNKENGDR